MANTVTTTTVLKGKKRKVLYVTVLSDGTEETATVLYDSSALNTPDPLTCTINRVFCSINSASTGAAGVLANAKLLFDASTDVLALGLPINSAGWLDFTSVGGLKNYAGTGITGDILLTTLGLQSGDSITLILDLGV